MTLVQKLRTKFSTQARELNDDEAGLNTVEYVVLLVLIVVVAVGLWKTFGGKVADNVDQGIEAMDTVNKAGTEAGGGK